MFQLVSFNLVWALPLDTGQKVLVIFIKTVQCKYGRLMLASQFVFWCLLCCLNCQFLDFMSLFPF